MIVRMKRVAVLCTAASEHETLEALQSLGVLHIDADGRAEAPALKEAQTSLDNAAKALAAVEAAAKAAGGERDTPAAPDAAATPESVLATLSRIDALGAQITDLERRLATYAPFGDFNPADFRAIEAAGLRLRLFRAPAAQVPEAAAGQAVRILAEDAKEKVAYGLAIGDVAFADAVETLPVPEKSSKEIAAALDAARASLKAEEAALAAMGPAIERLKGVVAERTTVRDFAAAQAAMGAESGVKWLTGYIPEEKLPEIREAAAAHGWGVAARDPADDEEPPTLIAPPKLFRPIVALFDMLGIAPGYREADVSVVFYSFFTVFFAMLVGDAGYGLLILALTVFLRGKFRKAPSVPFMLMGVFSLATILWGALTATYFGIPSSALPAWLKPASAAWLDSQSPEGQAHVMQLCFLIGATHLSVARVWNAVQLFPSKKFLAQIGWLGIVWTMYCAACKVAVNVPFPPFMVYVAAASSLLIALFMLDRSELKSKGVELGMLPLNIVSGLGDIISYVRLYAVGLSSVMVAQNFNSMATSLQLPMAVKIPCMVLILLLGHGLNLAMGALSILVHAVRLNTLEFSNHKGVTWSGHAYAPFRGARRGTK